MNRPPGVFSRGRVKYFQPYPGGLFEGVFEGGGGLFEYLEYLHWMEIIKRKIKHPISP